MRYLARGDGSVLYLTCEEAVLNLVAPPSGASEGAVASAALRMRFGRNGRPCYVEGTNPKDGRSHYLTCRDRDAWITNVHHYAKVRYREVHPGIDLVFYADQREFEYDFVVSPGADPSEILLTFERADNLAIDEAGRLVSTLGRHRVVHRRPVVYQPAESGHEDGSPALARAAVEARWTLSNTSGVAGFDIGEYDPARPLVIDPVIVFSSYLGGSGLDNAFGITVDEAGATYIAGESRSLDFPTTPGALVEAYPEGPRNGYVMKLNQAGDEVVFSTFLGAGNDSAYGVAVDPQGAVYVNGDARSTDFPVTPGAFDTDPGGNTSFAAKLSPDGSRLVYSTFIGNGGEVAGGIAVDDAGFAYVSGQTTSTSFPVVKAPQPAESSAQPDAFVAKLNQDGSALLFSTYWGGAEDRDWAEAVAVDKEGDIYITGWTEAEDFPTTPGAFQTVFRGPFEAFVTKFDPDAGRVIYSTLLGGSNRDWSYDITVDLLGQAHIVGETNTTDGSFPVTPGALKEEPENGEGFVAKFSRNGDALVYSTLIGGGLNEALYGIALDTAGHAYVGGSTNGLTEIETVNQIPGAAGEGLRMRVAALFAKLRVDGSGAWALFGIGGGDAVEQSNAIAIDGACNAYLTGQTSSKEFPTTPGAVQPSSPSDDSNRDGFVTKIDPSAEATEPVIGCRGVTLATGTPVLREG